MKDLLTALFSGLVKQPPLFTQFISLALGAMFLVIGAGIEFNIRNGEIKTDNSQKPILIVVGLVLISFYIFMVLFKEIKNQKLAEKDRKITKMQSDLNKCQERLKLNNLKQSISVFKDRNEVNSFSEPVLEGVEGMNESLKQHESTSTDVDRETAKEWVTQRINQWTEEIKSKDYSSDGISRKNINKFKKNVAKLLELLCQNIIDGTDNAPLGVDPQFYQTLGDKVIAHKKALEFIKKQMSDELDQDVKTLGRETIQYVKDRMTVLVECTNYKPY
ncbi:MULTISPECIES: hypothetical protein [Moorena]|uniref:Uncharacterized protein n=1 Tax=Moorena bouillonii PNG TaxID=568701 RepID=A0A1U7N7X5_9CYAN|nr:MULTISPECIES: hypothetical protein [Moorena]NEO24018.1 hypothetical protein [Moorena sp. SIO4A5]OLT62053.1 hypothetical protein BJP37_26510 [Moorena bouillonii PNG]